MHRTEQYRSLCHLAVIKFYLLTGLSKRREMSREVIQTGDVGNDPMHTRLIPKQTNLTSQNCVFGSEAHAIVVSYFPLWNGRKG